MRAGYSYTDPKNPPYPLRANGLADVRGLAVHHTGMGPARPTVQEVADFQIGPSAQAPFPGLAYWGQVEPAGEFVIAWDVETETWSQGIGSPFEDVNGQGINNARFVAVEFSGQDPTDQQWATILAIKDVLERVAGHPLILTSHGRVDPGTTACAGPVANARTVSP